MTSGYGTSCAAGVGPTGGRTRPHAIAAPVVWALTGACVTHLTAGRRHLWMDVSHKVSKAQGERSALFALVISGLLWLLVGAKILGLY